MFDSGQRWLARQVNAKRKIVIDMDARLAFTVATIALCIVGISFPQGVSAYGEIDPSFDSGLVANRECGKAIDVAGDGRIYLSVDRGVARFRGDGSLDASWGNGGVANFDLGWPGYSPAHIFLLADGRVIVIVRQYSGRLTRDGLRDTAFGDRFGLSERIRDDEGAYVESAAVQADGSVVALTRSPQGVPDVALTRIDARGMRDRSFGDVGTPGTLSLPFGTAYTEIYGWAVQSDGSIEIATFHVASDGRILPGVYRYPDGIPVAGRPVPIQGIANWLSPNAKVQPDGALVIASRSRTEGDEVTYVSRFDASGAVDTTFGEGGRQVVSQHSWHPWEQFPRALWLGPAGQMTLVNYAHYRFAGWAGFEDAGKFVFRLKPDGSLDPGFDNGRQISDPIDDPNDQGLAVQLEDGRLLQSYRQVDFGSTSAGTIKGCRLRKLATDTPRAEAAVVEYFHPKLNHYFLTVEGFESGILDDNVASMGWVRTGQTFGAWSPKNPPGASRVCRFYGDLVAGPNSHFYAPEGFECDALRALEAATPIGTRAWRLEKMAFSVALSTAGECPANLTAVFRVYNRGFEFGADPNHRYVTDPAIYALMQAQGWIGEGVRFCVPPAIRNDHLP